MTTKTGLKHIPVDLNEHIVPLGRILRIAHPDDSHKDEYKAAIETEDATLFTVLTPEDCCRRMWTAIKMFHNGY